MHDPAGKLLDPKLSMDPPLPEDVALIGSLGSGYIANALSTHNSLEAAIADVHQRGALGNLERYSCLRSGTRAWGSCW